MSELAVRIACEIAALEARVRVVADSYGFDADAEIAQAKQRSIDGPMSYKAVLDRLLSEMSERWSRGDGVTESTRLTSAGRLGGKMMGLRKGSR